MTTELFAKYLYETYCTHVGGRAFNGDALPDWETFSGDPEKTTQASAWRALAADAWVAVTQAVTAAVHRTDNTFGAAIAAAEAGFAFRLDSWQPDVFISMQKPDDSSRMTAPYLYVTSRFGRVPWIPTMIEILSKKWTIIPHPEAKESYVFEGPVAALPEDQMPARSRSSLRVLRLGSVTDKTPEPDEALDAKARIIAVNLRSKSDEEFESACRSMGAANPDMLARVMQQLQVLGSE